MRRLFRGRTHGHRLLLIALLVGGVLLAGGVAAQPTPPAQDQQTARPQPIEDPLSLATGFGIQLLQAPAGLGDDPRARSYVIDHVPAGSTIQRRILVLNNTADPAAFRLYAGAAEVTDQGWTPAPGQGGNQLTEWISVTPGSGQLGPVQQVEGLLRIQVPDDAEPGERYAVVWAERAAPDVVPEGEVGVTSRVGIRVYLSVGPGESPPTAFEITSLTPITRGDGVAVVRAAVSNTGERAIDLTGALTLTGGPGGLATEPLEVTPTTLASGRSGDIEVEVGPELPPGPWDAVLVLRSGTVQRQVQATLTFPEGAGEAPAEPVTSPDSDRALLILTALALQLGIGGAALMRSRDEG